MAQACIYTLDPAEGGGVPAKMLEVVSLLRQFGHDPSLLYNRTSDLPSHRREMLQYFLRIYPQWQTYQDLRGFALPYYPLPPWMTYITPLFLARSLINRSHIHVAVAGSNHSGLVPALLKKRLIVWIGKMYEEELRGRAAAGDVWARRVLQSPTRWLLAWEEKIVFERASLILTNGRHTAREVKTKYPSIAHRVRATIYPVDTVAFCPNPTIRLQQPCPYLLFTGRINDPRKNPPLLFNAFAKVRTHYPRLKLYVVGDTPSPAISRSAEVAGVEGNVEFWGRQPREELLRLYQGAELFVLPSLQEGLGISMLEAIACGVPVISTRCGGPESVIMPGETGLLVENGNPDALADGILQLLAHPVELEAMRVRCVEFARATFSKATVEQELLQAFRVVYPEYF